MNQVPSASLSDAKQIVQSDVRQLAAPFIQKSVSEETRRAYRRVITEFFRFVDGARPSEVTPRHVLAYRDGLIKRNKKAATVSFKLAVVRSFFEYLRAANIVVSNPASTRLVTPPAVPEAGAGRVLTMKEVRYLLSAPDRSTPEGARDYALLLVMLRLSVRVSEAVGLRRSSISKTGKRWVVRFIVKGGRERVLPLPDEVKIAIDDYLKLDAARRRLANSDGTDAYLFQPRVNFRTLELNKHLTTTMAWHIVRRWADYSGIGKLSPHDLRRTAITRALDLGMTYRQVQMMSGHRDPKTVMRYDHGRENLDLNAVNFLDYSEAEEK